MAEWKTGLIPIGEHNGWELFYSADSNSFIANKGRKQRREDQRRHLIDVIDDEDAKELRKKRRKEPCTFRWWDPEAEIDRTVTITSYSNKGIAVKPDNGDATIFLKTDRYRANSVKGVGVVTGDIKRLLQAVEGLRRAEAELAAAHKAAVTTVKVNEPGWGARVSEYHAEEDRLRAEINKVAAKAKETE